MIPLAKFAMLRAAGTPKTIAFFASATSNASTVTMPASVLANDIAILFDCASDADGSAPSSVTPSGWTAIDTSKSANNLASSGVDVRFNMSFKVLAGSEGGSSITGMNGNNNNTKVLLVFRPSSGTWGSPSSIGNVLGASTPTNQTVTVGAAPLVVLGCAMDPISGAPGLGMSPAADATVQDGFAIGKAGYKIHNTGPSNNTVSATESTGALGSFYIPLT
jgi:hypothetical protein